MSGQMWWIRDAEGAVHPDNSILLAYAREQNLGGDWLKVRHHLDICEECHQLYDEDVQVSTGLTATLKGLSYTQYYPSLVEKVLESINDPKAAQLARQERKRARLRQDLIKIQAQVLFGVSGVKNLMFSFLALVPNMLRLESRARKPENTAVATIRLSGILFFLLLLLMVIAVAFALSTHGALLPFRSSSSVVSATMQPNLKIQAHLTATARSTNNPTVNVSPTVTTGKSQPAIRPCTTDLDRSLSRIRVCGSNFTPGDKVELVVQMAGSSTRQRQQVTVDAQGTFQDAWAASACKGHVLTISVKDLTHASEGAPTLQVNRLGQCTLQVYAQ